MLKITRAVELNERIILQLDGSVTGPWIELLRGSAESVLAEGQQLTIDLENICFIDCEGLALIKRLLGQGVQQVNAPLFVAEQLRKCEAADGD
jgi:ABC-type transporter Mla MlaB component